MATVCLSSCCASMRVRVDVIDRATIEHSPEYQYFSLAGPLKTRMSAQFVSRTQDEIYKSIKAAWAQAGDKCDINADVLEKSSRTGAKTIVDAMQTAYAQAYNGLMKNSDERDFADIRKKMTDGDNIKGKLATTIREYIIASCGGTISTSLSNFIDDQATKVQETVTAYGNSIIGDPLASLVIKAPNKYWRKYKSKVDLLDAKTHEHSSYRHARANNTIVRTFFGNADVAVKMDAPGTFVVKGVRLDADQAIKTSFKVLNQGIKYLAYSQGITVANPASASNNSLTKIPEISANDSLSMQKEVLEQKNMLQLQAFLSICFGQKSNIESKDANKQKMAVQTIKQAYTQFKN